MKTFCIGGLPRTGTGWLSAFLTTDKSACLHEGLKFNNGSYRDLFEGLGKDICGDAGSHIPIVYADVLASYPDTKFVIVERDPEEVKPTAARLGITADWVDYTQDALVEMEKAVEVMKISFSDLFTLDGSKRVWEYCLGYEFDSIRWEIFRRLNIQATIPTHRETLEFIRTQKPTQLLNKH